MRHDRGFSLVELMIAMVITAGMAAIVFNLFLQNSNIFRDQNLVIEMQQSARAMASLIADELRMAGQGVPVYASIMDPTVTSESVQTFLNGTGANTVLFRAGIHNGTALVVSALPVTLPVGTPAGIMVDDVSVISGLVGGNNDRFVYVWGQTALSWTWVRARVGVVDDVNDALTVVAADVAAAGDSFPTTPRIYLEEAIGYQLSGTDLQRGSSGDFTTQTAPVMTYNTVGENFTSLSFTYYDDTDSVVTVAGINDRAQIRRVDFTLAARTAEQLPSTGQFGTFEITLTVRPRNVQLY